MAPVPRMLKLPLSVANSRGVVCSSAPGKLYAKVAHEAVAPPLAAAADPLQIGTVRHGGAHQPVIAVQSFFRSCKAAKVPAGAVFLDISAAFDSVLPEVALSE
jgi:hypothetical protein